MRLSTLFAVTLSILAASSALAINPGQVQTINSSGMPAWQDRSVSPNPSTAGPLRVPLAWYVDQNNSSLTGANCSSNINNSGSATNANNDTDGSMLKIIGGNSSGSNGQYIFRQAGMLGRIWVHMKTGSSTDLQHCTTGFGFGAWDTQLPSTGAGSPSGNLGNNCFIVCCDTDYSGTNPGNWQIYHSDASHSGSSYITDTGIAVAANTNYCMCIDYSNYPTSAQVWINGQKATTITTTLMDLAGSGNNGNFFAGVKTNDSNSHTVYLGNVFGDFQ